MIGSGRFVRSRRWIATGLAAAAAATAVGVGVAAPPAAAAETVEVTGVTLGGESLEGPLPATHQGYYYQRTDLRTFEGSISAMFLDVGWLEITRDVAGVGPVTLELRPTFPKTAYYGVSVFEGAVAADGTVTVPAARPPTLSVVVREVAVGGTTTAVYCTLAATDVVGSGRVDVDGTVVSHAGVLGAATGSCAGQQAAIEAALAGPASVDLWFPDENLLAVDDVPSELVVTPLATEGTVEEYIDVDVDVSYAPAGVDLRAPGEIQIYDDGVLVGSATRTADVTAVAPTRVRADLEQPGTRTLEVVYGGRFAGGVGFPLPSSTTFTVEVAPFPTGRDATVDITIGGATSTLPAGTVWSGADYDATTGEVGPGFLASRVGSVAIAGTPLGTLPTDLRLVQVGEVGATVRPDGRVDIDPVVLRVDARRSSAWGELRPCVSAPFAVGFDGTADATGLHLVATGVVAGPMPEFSCAGVADYINGVLASSPFDLSIDVAGDFTPPEAAAADVAVASWFGEVGQFNQTVLVAQVGSAGGGPAATGTVEFADGGEVLATAPVVDGTAAALVALSTVGDRTITATYTGPAGLGSATTSVLVAPPPAGDPLAGGLSVDGRSVAPAEGGVVVAPLGPGGATWWTPTTLSGDVGVGGPSTAEVRVLQQGTFSATPSGVRATFLLHLRSASVAGTTVVPLGCATEVTVDLAPDGSGGLVVSSGTSTPIASVWCRHPLVRAWLDELSGDVAGSIAMVGG